jgi:type VI secretion system protein ImpA
MISAEELLRPVSEEKPCGEDLSYDPAFQELEVLLRGKEETQFSAAEEPDWKQLRKQCEELWEKSKDLRVATTLAVAALKTEGLPGVKECLSLLKALLEKNWETVYPLLDPSDNNDPTQRVNIIAALAAPVGTYGDTMRFLERLRQLPLTNSMQMGRFCMADILRSETGEVGPDQSAPPTSSQIEAAFRDTRPEELTAMNQLLLDCIALAEGIDAVLTQTLGAEQAPDIDLLAKEFREAQKRLIPYLPTGDGAAPPPADGAAVTSATGAVMAPAGKPISGEIQSRQDVVRMIEKICDYYKKAEPSSPVPLLLRRALRWSEMDFMQVMDDLAPDAVKDIQKVTGEKPKEGE